MPTYKTPGVYVEEISLLPPSVAEVETAIPAFVGYTMKAPEDQTMRPIVVRSLQQFEELFGGADAQEAEVAIDEDDNGVLSVVSLTAPKSYYLLYFAMRMFYDNGGGKCYVVSVGQHDAGSVVPKIDELTAGVEAVAAADEPTLIVVPEMTALSKDEYTKLAATILQQCDRLGDRFAIFDVFGGDKAVDDWGPARVAFGNRPSLKYAAAYYPFVRTSLTFPYVETETRNDEGEVTDTKSNVKVKIGSGAAVDLGSLRVSDTAHYNFAKNALREHYVTMPPSAAVAGVYAATDSTRGVWKAPANLSLADVIAPVVAVDDELQKDMNVDSETGKSINAIRAFAGKGTLVWGARTLAGNDNEWRYISVRRFFNMVEESVKKSTYWAVFEPNDANTWVKVRGMIESYLTDKWRDGALAGATPKDAFFVKCGLGVTMNAQDILEGRLNVEIGMAVVRPAEFIILKFSHKLQTS